LRDDTPLAAIDMGSNSFRLEIGQLVRGRYRRIDYFKRTVRLGAGLDAESRLTEEAMRRGLDCLAEFAAQLKGFDPAHVRAVATQTLREAANRDAFLARATGVLGHAIEVISGREEARLIYSGVSHLQPSASPRLVVDIGGRSTELILGSGPKPLEAESFPVGAVGLSMRYFPDGRLDAGCFRAAQVAAGAQFEEALATFAPTRWREALGSSGTVGAVSDILSASGQTDGRITPAALAWLIDRCTEAGHIDRLDLAGLKLDRRAVMPGGLAILYTLAAHFGIHVMKPAKGALRQGVIVDLHARLLAPDHAQVTDMRDATVAALQRRFGVDMAQARRVRQLALALADAVCESDDAEARRELGWVCDLHEIGMALSHHDHHRHASYMLAHIDAAGFSQSQQRRLAALALAQRGGLRKVEDLLADRATAWLVLCLRLAVIACHARHDPKPPAPVLARRATDRAWLGWQPARLAPDPRTLYLLQEEAQAWARSGVITLELADA
jgi:exopolyphosphatase / guanosine-5'-triphosphate,3'-diphosphate pyrophosphatase